MQRAATVTHTHAPFICRSCSVCAVPWSELVWSGWVWLKWCLFVKRMLWVHTGSTTTAAWTVSALARTCTETAFWVMRALASRFHAGQWLHVLTGVVHFRANSTSGHEKTVYYKTLFETSPAFLLQSNVFIQVFRPWMLSSTTWHLLSFVCYYYFFYLQASPWNVTFIYRGVSSPLISPFYCK